MQLVVYWRGGETVASDSGARGRRSRSDGPIFEQLIAHGPTPLEDLAGSQRRSPIPARVGHWVHVGLLEIDRGSRIVRFPPVRSQTVGIYVGTASARIAVIDLNGQRLAYRAVDRLRYHDETFEWMLRRLDRPLREALAEARVELNAPLNLCGVAVAVPTLVEKGPNGGMIAATYPARWRDESLLDAFRQEYGGFIPNRVPVTFDCDASADLAAELRYGQALDDDRARSGVLMVHVSGGISAAFVDRGSAGAGARPRAAALGHVVADLHDLDVHRGELSPLRDSKTVCSCHRPDGGVRLHLDQVASGRAIAERLSFDAAATGDLVSYRDALDGPVAQLREDPEGSNNAAAAQAFREAAIVLGRALDGAVVALSPRTVVLGGYLSGVGDILRREVSDQLQSKYLRAGTHRPTVVLGTDHADYESRVELGAAGAGLLAMDAFVYPKIREDVQVPEDSQALSA